MAFSPVIINYFHVACTTKVPHPSETYSPALTQVPVIEGTTIDGVIYFPFIQPGNFLPGIFKDMHSDTT